MRNRRGHGDDSGAAAVEFGIVATLFIVLLLGTIQFGFTFWEYIQVAQAARVGARWAALGEDTLVVPRARAAAPGLDPSALVISAAPGATTDSVRVTVTYPTTVFAPIPGGGVLPPTISSTAEQKVE